MSNNQILIFLNGEEKSFFSSDTNKILLAKKKLENINHDHTLLQTNFESIEDLIKAEAIIRNQISKIDEIGIVYKDVDLNMISYQYDYNHMKQNYHVLMNVIYFINTLIPLFNKKISFILSFEKDNHYKIHLNNFKVSLNNYLNSLKIDLVKSSNISIKRLD